MTIATMTTPALIIHEKNMFQVTFYDNLLAIIEPAEPAFVDPI